MHGDTVKYVFVMIFNKETEVCANLSYRIT